MMLLIRASTGENWNYIMIDCYNSNGIIAIFYWVMFVIITTFVFLNIFVAVIYEAFNDIKSSEDANEVLSLKRKDIKAFISTWAYFN
jgi:cell division protein FtsB